MMSRITIPREEIEQCSLFVEHSFKLHMEEEWGLKHLKRSPEEIKRDMMIGKLGEAGVVRFFNQYFHTSLRVNYEIRPRYVGDDNDITLASGDSDIKGIRAGGHWLLVETNRLEMRKRQKRLPYSFIATSVEWDRVADIPKGIVDVVGYALLTDLCHPDRIGLHDDGLCMGIAGTYYLPHGSILPDTTTHLQADNCARRFQNLRTTWKNLLLPPP